MQSVAILLFESFQLDLADERLWRGVELVPLTAKSFAVLRYLVERSQRLVTRDDLFDAIWPQTYVSDGALRACIRELRRALQDSASEPRFIETVRGRGYRFVADVTTRPREPASTTDQLTSALPSSSPASIPDGRVLDTPPQQRTPIAPAYATQPSPTVERRQLTILFCDLVGSTALSEQLDPEELHDVLRAYYAACTGVIERFAGHVAQYLGDGILAYFGYPHAYEDAPHRAVHTGLDIVREIEVLNRHLERHYGLALAVRIGIHTGVVVVGDIGAGRHIEQLAIGTAPNIAARLQDLAAPNTAVLSASTYELVQGYFTCQAFGAQQIRGISQPVDVYRVEHESGAHSRLDVVPPRGLTPLVNREQEIRLLLERWTQVQHSAGQVVLINGEAGIGKSRLVQRLKELVADAPHLWLECYASSYPQHTTLDPIITLFRQTLHWQPSDKPEEKLQKLETALSHYHLPREELVPLFASVLSLPLAHDRYTVMTPPPLQRQQILETILTILLAQAVQQPLILVVEDLHWADATTLDFLTLLMDQVPTTSIYTLITCRPSFHPPWGHRSYVTHLTLNQLSSAEVDQILTWITSGKKLPAEVIEQLRCRADGVPLFVEEMTKTIIESGLLQEYHTHYELENPLSDLAIPPTLHDSLMARLDHLGHARYVAQLGATIGRQFAYDVLCAVSPWDEEELQSGLKSLVEAELLYQRGIVPQATFVFKHALIHDVAYQSLLKSTRQRYHTEIAQALEQLYTDNLEAPLLDLAHHFIQAGPVADIDKTVTYATQAGDHAVALFAWHDAARYYTAALSLGREHLSDQVRAALLFQAGAALYWDGDLVSCVRYYDEAIEVYCAIGDVRGLAQVQMKKTYLQISGSYGVSANMSALEELLEVLGLDAPDLRGYMMTALADLYSNARQPDRAAEMAQRALEVGHDLEDDQLCARASFNLAIAQNQNLQIHEALESYRQNRFYAKRAGSLWFEGWPLQRMPTALFMLGRFDEVEAIASEAHEFASKTNNWGHNSLAVSALAGLAVAKGDFTAIEQYVHETMDVVSRYRFQFGGALALPTLANAYMHRGLWEEAEQALELLMKPGYVFDDPEPSFGPLTRVYHGLIHAHAKRDQPLQEGIDEPFQRAVAQGRFDVTSVAPCCALVELAALVDEPAMAQPFYKPLERVAKRGIVFSWGWVFLIPRVLGLAAMLHHEWDQAETHFQTAIDVATEVGAHTELGRSYLDYACLFIARNGTDDRSQAIEYLHRAYQLLHELGMAPFAQRATELTVALSVGGR